MTNKQIKALQSHVGAVADGFWGPKSVASCQRHLRSLMPRPSPWPKTDQKSLSAFYGSPGDQSQLVSLKVTGLGVKYLGKPVSTIRCHRKVAASLGRIIAAIAALPEGPEFLAEYAGCFDNRPMRGGSLPSLHARGAAIDLAPATNGNRSHWPTRSSMPISIIEIFAREGWLSAGPFWGRDGMHHQATQ
jgi:hypothetical protein